ncbi:MAG: hypothetical protein ACKVPX_03545 [Myxococcaceae bacterium]
MRALSEHATLEEASQHLLSFVMRPRNWLPTPAASAGLPREEYQRQVGNLRVSASIEVNASLRVDLRVAFHAPGLTPYRAVEHLETFLRERFPLLPHTEWRVHIDQRKWIHFRRAWVGQCLTA